MQSRSRPQYRRSTRVPIIDVRSVGDPWLSTGIDQYMTTKSMDSMKEIGMTSYESSVSGSEKNITIECHVPLNLPYTSFIASERLFGEEFETPQIHVKVQTNGDQFDLHCLSIARAILKARVLLKKKQCRSYFLDDCLFHPARLSTYHSIEPNIWEYLVTVSKTSDFNDLILKFIFTIKIDSMDVYEEHQSDMCPLERNLSNDYENLLRSGLYSDVIIKSADGKEFKAHKAVLASRSDVFKANFEHNTKECYTNVLESPLEAAVLQEVLLFIYSGKTTMVNEIPGEMLVAADYYQLPNNFKSLCEETLRKKLTVKNAIDILQLADRHSADRLKKWTLEFIKKGNADLVMKTEAWAELQSVELIKRICEFISAK